MGNMKRPFFYIRPYFLELAYKLTAVCYTLLDEHIVALTKISSNDVRAAEQLQNGRSLSKYSNNVIPNYIYI